jgi:hypothetical protein
MVGGASLSNIISVVETRVSERLQQPLSSVATPKRFAIYAKPNLQP